MPEAGQTLSHYTLIEKIGQGGMGQVWRASDSRLGREVALKVLPAEMAADPQRIDRFRREAKALAALDHPGVVTVYSVEEADGLHFLTMQLVEGQPLDKLIPDGGLPVEQIVEIASGLADALAAAHDRGIVHRDLKPANVMMTTAGGIKVLDFGLARMSAKSSEEPGNFERSTELHTREGVVMGTVPYMSPEQIAGRRVDHRTDIFSVGVILYETATGRRPFTGQSSAELASSILRDPPPPLGGLRGDLPAGLVQVIGRCLEKDAADRFDSAREVRDGLSDTRSVPPPTRTAMIPSPHAATETVPRNARTDEGFWVAVLPFKVTGTDADVAALADGMTEEIVTGLFRFSYLKVIARSSTERYSGEVVDIRSVGQETGARYVMEGSLRQAGSTLRLAVQLVDASTGHHLWAETYNRSFSPDDVLALQDDLVPRIVSTVADWYGALPHGMSEAVRSRAAEQLTPYEAVLRSFGYFERITPEEHAVVRAALERAVEQSPGSADAWAMLSILYGEEHRFGFNAQPDPLERSLLAARRAVDAAHANHFAWLALAQAHFFRKELSAFRDAAERGIVLNPMDGSVLQYLAHLISFSGDWKRGCELAERTRELNPNHPGWYWSVQALDAYRRGEYETALDYLNKKLMRGGTAQVFSLGLLAAVQGQLEDREAARRTVDEVLDRQPDFARTVRGEFEKWYQPELVEQLMEGLRKAGLEAEASPVTQVSAVRPTSGEQRAAEGFWVAVLPFKVTGTDADVAALADGMTEEIVTGLARFSYLRILSRGVTARHDETSGDVGTVSGKIGARYLMEGSLRRAGSQLRVTVQLTDSETGAHLWAESYDRPFGTEQIFALQDDLVPRIVSTCADHFGVLARAISETVRGRPLEELSPYEALMRGFGYHFRLSPEEHAEARDALERAVEQAPNNADCLAMLSWVYSHEYAHEFNPRPGSLDRALDAARRAVDLAPSNHLAQQVLAVARFFRKETATCLSAAERALELNPLDGSNEAIFIITLLGDWERGRVLIRRSMELNPHHPGWYRLILSLDEYRRANYRAAVDEAVKSNLPDMLWTSFVLGAAYGQLGESVAARKALDGVLAQREDFADTGEAFLAKWFEPELCEHLMDGLRKAGL